MPDTRDGEARLGPSGSAGLRPVPGDGSAWHSRRYLPHFDQPGLVQMVTFRLADALPAPALAALAKLAVTDAQRRARLEALLDAGQGACILRDGRIARIVGDALQHFDGERYRLLAWVIMPNHVHVLIETLPGWPLASILQTWKSFTAKAANKLLGRTGRFWRPEYFDRAIRDERHLAGAIAYIHDNPVKAGLAGGPEEWAFSSAACAGPALGTGQRPALPEVGASMAAPAHRPFRPRAKP